jgi:hypothetical protein
MGVVPVLSGMVGGLYRGDEGADLTVEKGSWSHPFFVAVVPAAAQAMVRRVSRAPCCRQAWPGGG